MTLVKGEVIPTDKMEDPPDKTSTSVIPGQTTPLPVLLDQPKEEKLSNVRLWWIGSAASVMWFQGVCLICGSGFLLPVIQKEMNSSEGDVQWVTAAFNITWGCFALVSGRLADIYGLHKAFVAGMAWYTIWVFISSFMPNIIGLSFTRALAGIGYAVASPAAFGVIGNCFPTGRPKNIAYSVVTGAGAVGGGIGWLLGGLFISASPYTWRSLSFLISGISVYPLVVGFWVFPKSKPHPTDTKVDWIGAGLITVAQVLLGLGLTFPVSNKRGWRAPYIPIFWILAGISFMGFIWRQRFLNRLAGLHTYPPPLTPLRLFKNTRQLIVIYAGAMFVWGATDALAVMGAYFYEDILLLSGWESGLRVAPNTISGLIGAGLVGLLLHKIPARILLVVVDLLGGTSGILFAARPMIYPYWKSDLWAWLTTGVASDGTGAISAILISDCTAPGDQAVANALFISFERFGATLGLALSTIVRESVQTAKEKSLRIHLGMGVGQKLGWLEEQQAMWEGVKAALFFCGAGVYCAAVIVGLGMKGWDILGKTDRSNEQNDGKENVVSQEKSISSSPLSSLPTSDMC
ncbi:hypothetical protein M231_07275 [Tremella mesenterica]|uniref:Major facilitator superfamily (MFS) profile domain-containing protein n=1 Tax=Tremella mesenterica TaxID=5217 RepID=A0A4Q1BFW0_TREME|nr:hypothetical protein M231_07275 [Tremella mesenterica]